MKILTNRFKKFRHFIAALIPRKIRNVLPRSLSRRLYFIGVFHARYFGKPICRLYGFGEHVENDIYFYGLENCTEGKSMEIFIEICKKLQPAVIYDIGASTGTYGLVANSILPTSQVFYFEPLGRARELLEKNLKLNNISFKNFDEYSMHEVNAVIVPVAVSNYDGVADIFVPSNQEFTYSVTVNENIFHSNRDTISLTVATRRIDSLISDGEISAPGLVKMDVETHEPQVLSGFGVFLKLDIVFLIEVLSDEAGMRTQVFFPPSEYDYYNIDDRAKKVRRTVSIGKSDFYNYLICSRAQSSRLGEILDSG
jgi:FkbM family methyltransferase